MELNGKRLALYGRLLFVPRGDLTAEIVRRGGVVERDLTRRTHILVIGRGASNLIPSGHLVRQLQRAAGQDTLVIGEERLRNLLHGVDEPEPTYPLDRLRPEPPETLALLLNAFDLIHTANAMCRFRDVETLRTAARLFDDGHEMSSVIRILIQARGAPTGRYQIVTDDAGEPRLDWGNALTGIDGQGLLPLPAAPTLDDLFDAAMLAEAEERLHDAARDYALCTQMDRRDPIAPFNLGNVLSKLGQPKEAITRFGQAIARDPKFAEAYFNRSKLWEEAGETRRAIEDLRTAVELDKSYPQALFNLAQLELQYGSPQTASNLFEDFLQIDVSDEWRSLANRALTIAKKQCRND